MKTTTVTPLFITFFKISPCPVTAVYEVSSEIYGGFFYYGITLTKSKHFCGKSLQKISFIIIAKNNLVLLAL